MSGGKPTDQQSVTLPLANEGSQWCCHLGLKPNTLHVVGLAARCLDQPYSAPSLRQFQAGAETIGCEQTPLLRGARMADRFLYGGGSARLGLKGLNDSGKKGINNAHAIKAASYVQKE